MSSNTALYVLLTLLVQNFFANSYIFQTLDAYQRGVIHGMHHKYPEMKTIVRKCTVINPIHRNIPSYYPYGFTKCFTQLQLSSTETSMSPDSTEYDVYIESTDAYGMLYYPNYIIAAERGIMSFQNGLKRIVAAKTMKYKKPARLGDKLYVQCSKSKRSDSYISNVYRITNGEKEELFTATGIVSYPANDVIKTSINHSPALDNSFVSTYRVWPDECMNGGILSTKSILNYFERCRTDIIGGPAALASTAQDDVHVYVTRIGNFAVYEDISPSAEAVQVWTNIDVVGDLIIEFRQRLIDQDRKKLLAEATISTVCVMNDSPVPIPDSLRHVVGTYRYNTRES